MNTQSYIQFALLKLVLVTSLIAVNPVVIAADDEAVSKSLTTLFRASRKVISDNQSMINDESKGEKGLSGAAVAQMAMDNYQKAAGSPLAKNPAENAMLAAVKEVMADAQDLINQQGVGFKGFLPAVFARQVATRFSQKMSGSMTIKLTAPKKYVRNRANRPDKWEHNIIEAKFSSEGYERGKPFSESAAIKGKMAFRYILPEYYGESCLGCHGKPEGELDITGGKKEGGVLGELGGAISLAIFK